MYVQLFVAATLMAVGYIIFGRFGAYTPVLRRLGKLAFYLGGTALISIYAGTAWAWLWVFGMFDLGLTFNTWWTHKHGIGFLSAEPHNRYYARRGWQQ